MSFPESDFPAVTARSTLFRAAWPNALLAGALCLTLGACSSIQPYQADIQQGNVVTRERAAQLKPGMQREQVRDLLGTPLLTSLFHADRWDYVSTFRRQGQPVQERKLTVYFKNDQVERVEADPLPSETEFVASLDRVRTFSGRQPVLEATEQQLRDFQSGSSPEPTPQAQGTTGDAPVVYPPLESTGSAR